MAIDKSKGNIVTSFCLRYVFESENKLVAGDHINWSKPLDRGTSALRHLLVAKVIHFSMISSQNWIFWILLKLFSSSLLRTLNWSSSAPVLARSDSFNWSGFQRRNWSLYKGAFDQRTWIKLTVSLLYKVERGRDHRAFKSITTNRRKFTCHRPCSSEYLWYATWGEYSNNIY